MIAHVTKILLLVSVFFIGTANADVLHLNQKGQDELETSAVPKEGIVRGFNMQDRYLLWQPYRKNWEWDTDDDYIEIDLSWIQLLRPEIDTLEDIKNHRRLLDKYIQTGMIIPKYEQMWRGPYDLVNAILQTMTKIELNNKEESDPGVYQELSKFLDDLINEYSQYFSTGFSSPTTPEGRRQAFANLILHNIYVGYIFNDEKINKTHWSKAPYSTGAFYVDPRLVALKCYKYIQVIWKKYKDLNNVDMGFQLLQNSFVTGSSNNPEQKYKDRETEIRKQSPALMEAYYRQYPDHVYNGLQGWVMYDYLKFPSPLFDQDKHNLALETYIKVASPNDVKKIVDEIIFWNLEPDVYDGYNPDPFYLSVLQRLLATRATAGVELSQIIQRKADNLRGAEPDDPRWAELQFLQGLIVTP